MKLNVPRLFRGLNRLSLPPNVRTQAVPTLPPAILPFFGLLMCDEPHTHRRGCVLTHRCDQIPSNSAKDLPLCYACHETDRNPLRSGNHFHTLSDIGASILIKGNARLRQVAVSAVQPRLFHRRSGQYPSAPLRPIRTNLSSRRHIGLYNHQNQRNVHARLRICNRRERCLDCNSFLSATELLLMTILCNGRKDSPTSIKSAPFLAGFDHINGCVPTEKPKGSKA